MACLACDHTMQQMVGFWCPRCGATKLKGRHVEFVPPTNTHMWEVIEGISQACSALLDHGPMRCWHCDQLIVDGHTASCPVTTLHNAFEKMWKLKEKVQ